MKMWRLSEYLKSVRYNACKRRSSDLPERRERFVLNESWVGFPWLQSVLVMFAVRIMLGGKPPSLVDLPTINLGGTVNADASRSMIDFGRA